jgi:hypothetical protein
VELIASTQLSLVLEPWQADVDGDAVLDEYGFTRNPWPVGPRSPAYG